MLECRFCLIVQGDAPAWRVYEDTDSVAFLDVQQATPGHTLVVPRNHAADLWALSEDGAASLMRAVYRVAGLLRDRLAPLGLNVIQSNGVVAWQDVFHCHIHLLPRYGNDALVPPWTPTTPTEEQLQDIHQRIIGRD